MILTGTLYNIVTDQKSELSYPVSVCVCVCPCVLKITELNDLNVNI